MEEKLLEFLKNTGLSAEEAQYEADRIKMNLGQAQPGITYGGVWSEDLTSIWKRAERSGARHLVLEITAEGDNRDEYTGHLSVRIIEREDWQ